MNFSKSGPGRWVAAGMALSGMTVSAELPGLPEMPWLGHFVGYQNKKLQFGITSQGKATIKLIGAKDVPLGQMLSIPVEFLVEEIMPDGIAKVRTLRPETLESAQAATERPQNLIFRGKVKGDAGFEVTVSEDRGIVSLGGRLLDSGTVKNPLRFSIRLKIPDAYPYQKASGDRKIIKAFEEKTKNDRLQLTWNDGNRVKPATDKPLDAGSQELNGPGIAAAQIEFSSYQEKRLEISATPSSIIKLSGAPRPAPLREGFFLTWTADPAKDPEGKARLSFEVR